jgi:hypothetical protein
VNNPAGGEWTALLTDLGGGIKLSASPRQRGPRKRGPRKRSPRKRSPRKRSPRQRSLDQSEQASLTDVDDRAASAHKELLAVPSPDRGGDPEIGDDLDADGDPAGEDPDGRALGWGPRLHWATHKVVGDMR